MTDSQKNNRLRKGSLIFSLFLIVILTLSSFNITQVKAYTLYVENNVDAQNPDVDSGGDKGTASALSGAQTLDGSDQTLTEESTGGAGSTLEYYGGGDGGTGTVNDRSYAYDESLSTYAWFTFAADGFPYFSVDTFDTGSGTITNVDVLVRASVTAATGNDVYTMYWEVNSVTGGDLWSESGSARSLDNYTWESLSEPQDSDWSWTDIGNFELLFDCDKKQGADGGWINVYEVILLVTVSASTNYELDWEYQIQNVDLGKDRYNLTCFGYASGGDSETFSIYIWNSSWYDTGIDLTTSEEWHNVSISGSGITSSTTFRILGNTESSDTTQSVANIDYFGIRGWNFTVDIINTTFSLTGTESVSGNYSVGTSYSLGSLLLINVSSGDIYTLQIKGTDILNTSVSDGYIYWDNDDNPTGSTQLTTSYANWKTSQSVGDKIQHSIYIFIIVPWTGDEYYVQENWSFSIEVQIITG